LKVYVAETDCRYKDKRYKPGEELEYEGLEVPCDKCEGKGCRFCKMVGRLEPPCHFTLKENQEEEQKEAEAKEEATIEELRTQLEELGGKVDYRWKTDRLKEEIVNQRKELDAAG